MLQHPVRRQPLGAAATGTAGLAVAETGLPPSALSLGPGRPSARPRLVAVPSDPVVVEEAPCDCPLHSPMTSDPRPTLDDVVRQAARLRVVVSWILGLALLGLLVLLMR